MNTTGERVEITPELLARIEENAPDPYIWLGEVGAELTVCGYRLPPVLSALVARIRELEDRVESLDRALHGPELSDEVRAAIEDEVEDRSGTLNQHCWHPSGVGASHGFGGADEVICCHCGARAARPWREVERAAEGHGPHYRARTREAFPVQCTTECPASRRP